MSELAIGLRQKLQGLDRVLATIVTMMLAMTLLWPNQAAESLQFLLRSLIEVAPFLLASVAIAAFTKASGADSLIARAFSGQAATMIIAASLMGAFSPFCSCGVIPLIAALLAMGVALPPVMAFWLASPLMDPSMFVLTAGTLGIGFALFKTAAAIAAGLIGGFGTHAILASGALKNPLRPGIGDGGCRGSTIRNPGQVLWRFWEDAGRRATFFANAGSNVLFLGKWLALAYLLESLMLATVPPETVVRLVGGEGLWPILMATVVGIPAYLNGYAALPLVGGLIDQGMAPGAGMAFLLAGGVTCVPAAIAVWALTRPPVFAAYVGFAIVSAITMGVVFGIINV